jgi:ATP-dependent protease ClpP protease subunit
VTWARVHQIDRTAHLFVGDEIGFGQSVDDVCRDLDGAEKVELAVNSLGGCGRTTERLFTELRGRTPVATITGNACSSGAFLTLAADKVLIVPTGRMMLHAPRIRVDICTAEQLRATADYLEQKMLPAWIDRLCDRVNADVAQVCRWLSGSEDHYFDAEQSVELGLAHEIYTPPPRAKIGKTIAIEETNTAPAMRGNDELLIELLKAFGPVTTSDAASWQPGRRCPFARCLDEFHSLFRLGSRFAPQLQLGARSAGGLRVLSLSGGQPSPEWGNPVRAERGVAGLRCRTCHRRGIGSHPV